MSKLHPYQQLTAKAAVDPNLRARLQSDPKTVLGEFGLQVPEKAEVQTWQDTQHEIHVVLPQDATAKDHAAIDALRKQAASQDKTVTVHQNSATVVHVPIRSSHQNLMDQGSAVLSSTLKSVMVSVAVEIEMMVVAVAVTSLS